MRINIGLPQNYTQRIQPPVQNRQTDSTAHAQNPARMERERMPGHIVYRISPQGMAASRVLSALNLNFTQAAVNTRPQEAPADNISDISGIAEMQGAHICLTCQERRYVDQSADGTVSFQMPTNIAPEAAKALIAAHEMEHIANERDNAERNGREVVSESVTIHTAICPECGMIYIAGGQAETITVPGEEETHPVIDLLNSLEI